MYLHPYKGQFLIIHDPKNTFEDEMHDGLQTQLIFLSAEIQVFRDFLFSIEKFPFR